jgi:Tol biopolymer transport system component
LKTDGSYIERLSVFGAYRWRSDGHLLLLPFDPSVSHPGLYQLDFDNHKVWKLADPEVIQLAIANNDWSISPNGKWLLYLSTEDRNLWLLELPEPPQSS